MMCAFGGRAESIRSTGNNKEGTLELRKAIRSISHLLMLTKYPLSLPSGVIDNDFFTWPS